MKELLSILMLLHTLFPANTPSLTQIQPKVVCIDPGHGGDDPGATNQDITEAEETLDIGQRLKSLLESHDYSVVMTRTDNTTSLTNSQRADICNNANANILISIHLNYNDDTTLDYTQGLYGTGQETKDEQFTNIMHQTMVKDLNLPDGDTTDFGDNVLMRANMPATLQETIFISSSDEYQQLTDGTGNRQQQVAQALFDGISTWFAKK